VGGGVSASASQSKVSADYLSVVEQSGIKAGDGGFQIGVKSKTDLQGGLITSSQSACRQVNQSDADAASLSRPGWPRELRRVLGGNTSDTGWRCCDQPMAEHRCDAAYVRPLGTPSSHQGRAV
jgi:hypothetical protein